jgi:hypothetical protein
VSNRNSNRTRLIAGAFVAAAVAVPLYAAAVFTDSTQVTAAPACLAWFGNKDDGQCLSYSNGQPINASTPWYNGGNSPNAGISTGPLLPGQTWNTPVG